VLFLVKNVSYSDSYSFIPVFPILYGEKMHELMKLPYEYDALEPYMDAKTVEIHYTKHHAGYVNKLNASLEKHPELFEKSLDELLKDLNSVPEDIRTSVKNNGGGAANHDLYWSIMKPGGSKEPTGELADAMEEFGGFESFKEKFGSAAKGHFASGWAWLALSEGKPEVFSTPGHESPVSMNKAPLLVIDVWEHAYYLKYQNRRADFVDNFFSLVNWDAVLENYKKALL
jgi:Fe-Mn family superoxide dismutase